MTAAKKGSMFQRLASTRLMDPAPSRIAALERRIIHAIKRGELTAARRLLVRRLALCGPADPSRAGVEKVARVVEGGIAAGYDGVPQDDPAFRGSQSKGLSPGASTRQPQ